MPLAVRVYTVVHSIVAYCMGLLLQRETRRVYNMLLKDGDEFDG